MFKVNYKDTITTSVYIDFYGRSHFVLVFLLLTLSRYIPSGSGSITFFTDLGKHSFPQSVGRVEVYLDNKRLIA